MSSICHRPNGHRWIQFSLDGSRKTLRLGRISQREAIAIQGHVDQLLISNTLGLPLEPNTRAWLSIVSDTLARRLSGTGLHSVIQIRTVLQLCDAFMESVSVRPSTLVSYRAHVACLVRAFGMLQLSSVTPADADSFRRSLLEGGGVGGTPLARATVAVRIDFAKRLFGWAVRNGWIESNPFAGVRTDVKVNPYRLVFVSQTDVQRLIDHVDRETGLMLVMARWGGMRIPSEARVAKWADVDWEAGTILVRCVKTERHAGRQTRVVPLFPHLRQALTDAWERAPEGTEYVFDAARKITGAAIHRRVARACEALGITPWPRLLQNLRASRENELNDRFPAHVVSSWIGHTQRIAEAHYLKVTRDHIQAAIGEAKPEADHAR